MRPLKLITYETALNLIKSSIGSPIVSDEVMRVDSAIGRISSEKIVAPVDIPPVEKSAMDGYAVLSEHSRGASVQSPVRFRIAGKVMPGQSAPSLNANEHEAYYASLGSDIPLGTDVVVKVEDVRVDGEYIELRREIQKGKNVIKRGEDFVKGYTIIERGQEITAAHAAMLIASGIYYVKSFNFPRIGVLSVGNELRDLDEQKEGAAVNTYRFLIEYYLREINATPIQMGTVSSSKDDITRRISESIENLDAVITLGGSSVGENDNTYDGVIQCNGAVPVYHGIGLLPIKPTGLALIGSKPAMVLPGQAVSSTISFFLTALPTINALMGMELHSRTVNVIAKMKNDLINEHELDAVRLVRIISGPNGLEAEPLKWGMNILSNLTQAGGFIILRSKEKVKKGDIVNTIVLGSHGFYNIKQGDEAVN